MACTERTEPQQTALPSTAAAPGLARAYVAEHAARLPRDLIGDALVLVSELVTNAVRHGRPMITLSIRDDPPGIDVSVSDRGRALPRLPSSEPDDTAMSGRGLLIVDALATAWGVTLMDPPPGKTVWFRLAPKSRP